MSEKKYFVRNGSVIRGPFTTERINQLLAQGVIDATAEISAEKINWNLLQDMAIIPESALPEKPPETLAEPMMPDAMPAVSAMPETEQADPAFQDNAVDEGAEMLSEAAPSAPEIKLGRSCRMPVEVLSLWWDAARVQERIAGNARPICHPAGFLALFCATFCTLLGHVLFAARYPESAQKIIAIRTYIVIAGFHLLLWGFFAIIHGLPDMPKQKKIRGISWFSAAACAMIFALIQTLGSSVFFLLNKNLYELHAFKLAFASAILLFLWSLLFGNLFGFVRKFFRNFGTLPDPWASVLGSLFTGGMGMVYFYAIIFPIFQAMGAFPW